MVSAPLRVLPRSLAPSGAPWGRAVRSRFPPTWLGAMRPPWDGSVAFVCRGAGWGGGGRPVVGRSLPPDCPPTGRAVVVRHPHAVGAGVWVWGPNTVPLACTPCWGCVPRGWWGAVPGEGGLPATVVRGVWCQVLSLPRPPVLWGGQPGYHDPCVPGAVGAAVGTQHRFHSVRPCGPALLAVGVVEGRYRGGCLPTL